MRVKIFLPLLLFILTLSLPSFSQARCKDGHMDKGTKQCCMDGQKKCCMDGPMNKGHKKGAMMMDDNECKLCCPFIAVDKAKDLGLNKKQIAQLNKIKKNAAAQGDSLMSQIHKKNQALTRDVLAGRVKEADLEGRALEVAKLHAKMRVARLTAHIKTMELLSKEQVEKLNEASCPRKDKKMDKKCDGKDDGMCELKKDDSKDHEKHH